LIRPHAYLPARKRAIAGANLRHPIDRYTDDRAIRLQRDRHPLCRNVTRDCVAAQHRPIVDAKQRHLARAQQVHVVARHRHACAVIAPTHTGRSRACAAAVLLPCGDGDICVCAARVGGDVVEAGADVAEGVGSEAEVACAFAPVGAKVSGISAIEVVGEGGDGRGCGSGLQSRQRTYRFAYGKIQRRARRNLRLRRARVFSLCPQRDLSPEGERHQQPATESQVPNP
jgi:hypothetical protein